jgi:deoxyribodipyrimidine photo-lyase
MLNIFWFRRDLRLEDNTGLYYALAKGLPVLPVFIFDQEILQKLENRQDARVSFIYDEIENLKKQLENYDSSLFTRFGKPEVIFAELLRSYSISTVYANHDYEPYSAQRDSMIEKLLQQHGIKFVTFKDQVIFEKDEIKKDSGGPYTVFTPYANKWKNTFYLRDITSFPSEKMKDNFFRTGAFPFPTI